MTMRTSLWLRVALCMAAMGLTACAGGQVDPDASFPDDDVPRFNDLGNDPFDAPAPDAPPDPGPCGQARQECCGGTACERGMECREGACCALPTAMCTGASDCCDGMQCAAGRCCHGMGARCDNSGEGCGGTNCGGGPCQAASSSCGGDGPACCAGDICQAGFACVGSSCRAGRSILTFGASVDS